jgi:3',5'-nucleoside bisphosphate phosphatase
MRNCDLHTHTNHSDGVHTPTELVEKAKEVGLEVIAITDHNVVSGNEEAIKAGERLGVEVISGCEIACEEGEVLAYFIDYKNPILHEFLTRIDEAKYGMRTGIIEKLNQAGMEISLEEIKNKYPVFNSSNIAREMIEKGYAKNFRDAFDTYIGQGRPCYCEFEGVTALDVVKMIKRVGGLAVLAHPWIVGLKRFQKQMDQLIEAGLDGIECANFAKNDLHGESIEWAKQVSDKYGLVLTSGSDYHGPHHPDNMIGDYNCDGSVVDALKTRLSDL